MNDLCAHDKLIFDDFILLWEIKANQQSGGFLM